MVLKKINELEGKEVLARPLMTWDYQIILPEGAVLRLEYIKKLEELGIIEVWIRNEQSVGNEIVILKSEIEIMVKKKVKKILQRHTYHNNEELSELSNTADDIISTILEEDHVIEKVYDIKQRSADIYEHSISICSMAILTSLKINLDRSTIHDIGVGCLLHDIGLRCLPFQFENLDMEDMKENDAAEYKKHPVYGYTDLKDEDWISDLSKGIILYHHERLDGSGFPLKASSFPVECSIVSICDVFDEMICGIACRRSKVCEALEYLKTFKNIKFDGKIVDVFLGFTAVYPAGTRVLTNEGEIALVLHQNPDFQDRPVLRIIKDKNGSEVREIMIKDLVKVHNVFIEKALD